MVYYLKYRWIRWKRGLKSVWETDFETQGAPEHEGIPWHRYHEKNLGEHKQKVRFIMQTNKC